MKRWQKIVIGAVVVLIVLAGGAYWAMNKAVDKVLEAVAGDVLSSMQASPSPNSEATTQPTNDPKPTISPAASDTEAEATATPQVSNPTTPGTSISPEGEATPNPTPDSTSYDPSIDADKAAKAQEEITLKEKLQVTSIFMKKFNAKELDAFMKLASGGLTHEEKIEAKELVLEKLSEEEYDQLIGIAAKLGLSQGKSYQEAILEK